MTLLRLQLHKERLMAFVVHDLKNPVNRWIFTRRSSSDTAVCPWTRPTLWQPFAGRQSSSRV